MHGSPSRCARSLLLLTRSGFPWRGPGERQVASLYFWTTCQCHLFNHFREQSIVVQGRKTVLGPESSKNQPDPDDTFFDTYVCSTCFLLDLLLFCPRVKCEHCYVTSINKEPLSKPAFLQPPTLCLILTYTKRAQRRGPII